METGTGSYSALNTPTKSELSGGTDDYAVTAGEIETGDLLLFPSWLDHGVKANMTDNARINIAFNFGCPEWVDALS